MSLKHKKMLLRTVKIGIGSSLAIFIATALGLQYATSAGIITLLTIVTTKWETVRLSLYRILSFGISIIIAGVLFHLVTIQWIEFGIYIFLVVLVCNLLEWQATISVNAVVGTHLLSERSFDVQFILNEFGLVVIGIVIAIILNLFHGNREHREKIIRNMRYTEDQLRTILGQVAAYLDNQQMQYSVWSRLGELEKELYQFVGQAYEYQDNTFHSHPEYYIQYFEMRTKQCSILHNLHYEMRRIRKIPAQAAKVAGYIHYLTGFVTEANHPKEQIDKLDAIFEEMKLEPLPKTREEFENRAILYHILMDLEEFLILKRRFVDDLSEKQKQRYWDGKKV